MADILITEPVEIWKPIPGWEALYEVSSFGRVRSLATSYRARRKGRDTTVSRKPRILKPSLTVGYLMVSLCHGGKCAKMYVHRLVCSAFHGVLDNLDVAHNDGVKTNNTPSNLRWATRKENMLDKVAHGTQKRGDELWFTKVSDADVLAIRSGNSKSPKEWAASLGVSVSCINNIKAYRKRIGAL